MKIINSPNMVCMVKHATEDLQHRNLDFSKYLLLHFHVKMERVRQREERLRQQREQYTEQKSKKQKSNGNLGWQDRVLH